MLLYSGYHCAHLWSDPSFEMIIFCIFEETWEMNSLLNVALNMKKNVAIIMQIIPDRAAVICALVIFLQLLLLWTRPDSWWRGPIFSTMGEEGRKDSFTGWLRISSSNETLMFCKQQLFLSLNCIFYDILRCQNICHFDFTTLWNEGWHFLQMWPSFLIR